MEKKVDMERIFRPGETCPCSGQYAIVDADGKAIGPERTVVREERFPPTPQRGQGYLLVDPTRYDATATNYSTQVHALVAYYMVVLLFSFWFLFDTWSSNFTLMRLIGVSEKALEDPLLRSIGFTIVGGIMGSLLYQIRVLFHHYARQKNYDPRWLGKYITGPWEGAGMAMVVLALIRGGVAVFGGSMETDVTGARGTDVTGASNFAAFGTGALVGFGMRDVVGWLESLVKVVFTIQEPKTVEDSPEDGEPDTQTQS